MTTSFVFPPDPLAGSPNAYAAVPLTTARLAVELIDAASRALDCERDAARLYLERAAEVLSMDAVEPGGSGAPGPRLTLWQRRRVLSLINERIGGRLSLDDLAAAARLSRSYFARAFKSSFEQTPHAYVMAHRITTAQLAMITSDQPLCEIALACGFGDQAHFTRAFRKTVGRPPHVWRRLACAPAAFATEDLR